MSVDDEPDMEMLIRQKFRRLIRKGEYEFVFAINGLEALAKLIEHPDIDIILTDINMPEMDGLTLLTKINELKNPILKTIIVSAYGDMGNIRTAMNRGAFDFATKPIDFSDLEITMRKALEEIKILKQAQKEHNQLTAIQHDLNIAKEIQMSILPKDFPPFLDRKEFDLFASMNAAKSVGGDFYDFFLIDENHLGVVIADVSDKGIPAAIYMAISRTILRATALKGMMPEECLDYSNELLCKENISNMFVTVFYGILDLKSGEMVYSNGGHNPPMIVRKDGAVEVTQGTKDIVLGVLDWKEFHTKSIHLTEGNTLFLFTDGVTEAMNVGKQLYGNDRLKQTLAQSVGKNAREIVEMVASDVKKFTEGAEQSDDITMLALTYF